MSSTKNIISLDTLKTIGQGALGAMTFGAYHQFTSNKMMELNNQMMELNNKIIKQQHQTDITMLTEKINKLEQKEQKRWW